MAHWTDRPTARGTGTNPRDLSLCQRAAHLVSRRLASVTSEQIRRSGATPTAVQVDAPGGSDDGAGLGRYRQR